MRGLKKQELIEVVSHKIRLVRNEYNFTQEKMADLIGLSKKTLVQIEKGRTLASWTVVIAMCGLFRESEILHMTVGEDPIEVIEAISFEKISVPKRKVSRNHLFWEAVKSKNGFIIERNTFSNHFRIVDFEGKRWYSSFNRQLVDKHFDELIERGQERAKEDQ